MGTISIETNVTLTADEKARIQEHIIDKRNTVKALAISGVGYRAFASAMEGLPIKSNKRDMLLQFCDMVEGKSDTQ